MPENPTSDYENLPEYSVSELSHALKRTVEDAYSYVRVKGELSRVTRPASGHVYLSLKDDSAVLDGVCWRGVAGRLKIQPEEGLEVICTGKLTTYAQRSSYQIVVESMELAGEGALLKLLEERRKKLAAEGLFDEAKKQELPFLPDVIGVVTSPTGAVIRDILHRLADRFPRHVLIWPVLVQGEGSAEQVAAAIQGFNALNGKADGPPRPDLLIVARGGGSLEDLWSFNEEIVVRAAAASEIPLIAAVGHETDWTLIDHAADRRSPTPTAAAEIAVPVRTDLLASVLDDAGRLMVAARRLLEERRVRVEGLARGLPDPVSALRAREQRLDDLGERLRSAVRNEAVLRRTRVEGLAARLRSPLQILGDSQERLDREGQALAVAWSQCHRRAAERAGQIADRLSSRPLRRRLDEATARLDELGRRGHGEAGRRVEDARQRWTRLADLLESVSFRRVLERGYAVVRDGKAAAITAAASAEPGAAVSIEFADGKVDAVLGTTPSTKPRASRRRKKSDTRQGNLL